MDRIISAMLVVAAIIHLVPVSGLLGAESLTRLYGLDFAEPNLAILMRHRAVLFGLVGSLLACAAFRPALRPLALIAGLTSVVSFLWLAWSAGGYNALIARVVWVDVLALACLLVATSLHFLRPDPSDRPHV